MKRYGWDKNHVIVKRIGEMSMSIAEFPCEIIER
jgi:hypothetical protein